MLIFNRLLARNILALIRSKFRFLKIHSTGAKSAATYPIEPSIPDAYEICAKGRADKVNTSMRTDRVVVIPSKICPLNFEQKLNQRSKWMRRELMFILSKRLMHKQLHISKRSKYIRNRSNLTPIVSETLKR